MIGWSGGVASGAATGGAVLGATSTDDPGGGDLGAALYVQQRRIASDGTVTTSAEGSTSPNASDADLAAFQAQRASAATIPEPSIEIDSLAQDWLDTAAADETTTFVIKLADQPALALPQMEDRLIAIEARKTEVDALQADLVAELEALGADVTGRYWTVNALQLQADADTIRAISDSPLIARIELNAGDLNETVNLGENIRVATQIKQYLDNGFDGSTSSGRSAIDTIYVALVDNKVDIDHPAWDDCSPTCVSRLVRQEEWTGSAWIEDTVGNAGGEQHGNLDPDDYYGQQKRAVYTAFYWEDRARDDADGPDTGIQWQWRKHEQAHHSY
ncbi:MAG: hypothetical protein GXP62_08210 [Oligoflexia bacterium]|nr:hypothetical protein [Oligoflexia bacterium]